MPSVNGIPSVTEILTAVGLCQDYSFLGDQAEYYRNRGTAIHQAIQWFEEGTLDEASLHPEIRPALAAYRRFVEETGHMVEASELELIHPWGFCGHLDRVGLVNGDLAICDWKSGTSLDLKGATLQLAGYGLLYAHQLGIEYPDRPLPDVKRYIVHLKPDGTYKLIDVTDAYSLQIFLAAVIVHRAREGT